MCGFFSVRKPSPGKNLLQRSTGLNYSGNTCIPCITLIRIDLARAIAMSNLPLPWFTTCWVVRWHQLCWSEERQMANVKVWARGGGQRVLGLGKCVDSGESWRCGLILVVPTCTVSLRLMLLLKINLPLKATFILWPALNALLGEGRFCWQNLFFLLFPQVNFKGASTLQCQKQEALVTEVWSPPVYCLLPFCCFFFLKAYLSPKTRSWGNAVLAKLQNLLSLALAFFPPSFFPIIWDRRALLQLICPLL